MIVEKFATSDFVQPPKLTKTPGTPPSNSNNTILTYSNVSNDEANATIQIKVVRVDIRNSITSKLHVMVPKYLRARPVPNQPYM